MRKIVLAIIGIACLSSIAYAEPGVFVRDLKSGQAWKINTSSAGVNSDSRYDGKISTATAGKFISKAASGKVTAKTIAFSPDYISLKTVGVDAVLRSTGIFGSASVTLFAGQTQEFRFSIPASGSSNDITGLLGNDTTVYYTITGVK